MSLGVCSMMCTQWNIFAFMYTCIFFYRHVHLQVQWKLVACHTVVAYQILMPCLDLLQSVQDSAGRIPQNKPQLLLLCSFTPIHPYDTIWPKCEFNPLNPKLNPICYLLALLGANHFLHVSGIRVKLLTFRRLMSYIYGAPILDVSRSHTTTQHSR